MTEPLEPATLPNLVEARRPQPVHRGEQPLAHQLRRAHDVGRVHGLVRRGEEHLLQIVVLRRLDDVLDAVHVHVQRAKGAPLA
jgi:hypothetical protein